MNLFNRLNNISSLSNFIFLQKFIEMPLFGCFKYCYFLKWYNKFYCIYYIFGFGTLQYKQLVFLSNFRL